MKKSEDIHGKVVLITGATSGIGKETAVALAKMGATVVAVGRNRERSETAVEEIKSRSASQNVELLLADLSSLAEVRTLSRRFLERHSRLHVLINNAGFASKMRTATAEGIESQWAVNYLAPFLLTHLLLDCLKKSAPARVINVSATLHKLGTLDFDDLEMENGYRGLKMYARSKTALNSFTFELAKRVAGDGITVNCLHPGVVKTNFKATALFPMAALFRPFFTSSEKGAGNTIFLATAPELDGVTGQYYLSHETANASAESRDPKKAKHLYELTEKQVELMV